MLFTKQHQINIKFFLKHKKAQFYCEVDQNWNRLTRDVVESPFLKIFKKLFEQGQEQPTLCSPSLAGGLDKTISRSLCQP